MRSLDVMTFNVFVDRPPWLRATGPAPTAPTDRLGPSARDQSAYQSFIVSLGFVMIEAIGRSPKNPFGHTPMNTPMTAICRTIEINLRQQLGETELPDKLGPAKSVLMSSDAALPSQRISPTSCCCR
ncbi:MAG: hypothetical protein ACYSWT_12450 [Planctomycetota bacterium]